MVSKLCLPISSALMLSGAGGMVSLTEAAAVSGSFLKVAPIDRCEALTSEASAALDRAVAQFSRPKAAGPARDAQGGEKATQPSWASRCSSSCDVPLRLLSDGGGICARGRHWMAGFRLGNSGRVKQQGAGRCLHWV